MFCGSHRLSLLTDRELSALGVTKVGDRAILRKQCRDSIHSKNP